jgi:alanyl aminopeptidase
VTDEVFPEYGLADNLALDADRAMLTDGRLTTRAIRQPVTRLDNLLQSADVLAYQKGQSVLGMFEQWLGPEVFRAGVRDYVSRHAWGNATADDLWAALSRAAKKDVGAVMGTFLNQPGLALVDVEPLPGGRVRLAQSRFLPAGTVSSTPQRWSIPITLKYGLAGGAAKTKAVLLTGPTQVVTLEPGAKWVYPNGRGWGYYRWRMPEASIAALVASASTTLETRERIELTMNAAALLDAGAMPGDTYLGVLEKLAGDSEPAVLGAVLDGMQKVKETFVTPEVEPAFAAYVDRALTPAVGRFGMERRPGEHESVSFVRGRLLGMLADEGRSAWARAYGDSLAKVYLADAAAVDPALVSTALQIAALGGDAALWETYRTRFEAAPNPGERRNFLSALGGFRAPELTQKSLDYALAGPLRPQEVFALPRGIGGGSAAGREAQFRWVTANYEAILKRVPPMVSVFLPYAASGCSGELLVAGQAFFSDPAHAPPGTEKELAKVTEQVEDCVKLRAREGGRVREYLQRTPVAN